jgi:hypothetical protein
MSKEDISWVKNLISTDAKALGVYIAILWLRFIFSNSKSMNIEDYPFFEKTMKNFLALYPIGKFRLEVFEAAKTFFNQFFTRYGSKASEEVSRNSLLEQIEGEFFETFAKAYRKFLKIDEIPRTYRERIALLLRKIRSREIYINDTTIMGSIVISRSRINEYLKSLKLKEDEIAIPHQYLVKSGFALPAFSDHIIPVPCFMDDVLRLLEEERGVAEVKPQPPIGLDAVAGLREVCLEGLVTGYGCSNFEKGRCFSWF